MPPPVVALAGWLLPGSGYWLLGQWARGSIVFAAILTLYLLGLLVAGVRVIEVPGYDAHGNEIQVRGQWIITHGGLMSEVSSKPWFVCQILTGPVCLASAILTMRRRRHPDAPPGVSAVHRSAADLQLVVRAADPAVPAVFDRV
jgi:hypothetical protein